MADDGEKNAPIDMIALHLARMQALLRIISPQSPFQPILTSSIDLPAWADLFCESAEALETALRRLPKGAARSAALSGSRQLFSLVDTLCGPAQMHCRSQAALNHDTLPAIDAFDPTNAMSEPDAQAIKRAIDAAHTLHGRSAPQRRLIAKTIDISVQRLASALQGKSGLLPLIKARGRKSRRFAETHRELVATLEMALARARETAGKPWEEQRLQLAQLRHLLTDVLLGELDNILKQITPRVRTAATPARQPPRDALKKKLSQAMDAFVESHLLSQSLDATHAMLTLKLWATFSETLADATRAMAATGLVVPATHLPGRLIDAIQTLPDRLIARRLHTAWSQTLADSDQHELEVVLAALHHLERSDDDSHRKEPHWSFSEADAASWLRRGSYRGADPARVLSSKRLAESRRTRRTLQRLRHVGGAFHDRRQWTPTTTRGAQRTSRRYWTVNPLLILLPQVSTRLAFGVENLPPALGAADKPLPRCPSRRNRGKPSRR